MNVIKEVLTDAQMLYTKKDVIVLLEQMQEQTTDKAYEWLDKSLYATVKTNFVNIDVESRQTFLEKFKQAMKGE